MLRFAFLALLVALPALAEQEIEVRADVVETESLDGTAPLQAHGDVRVRNGSLLLRAPTLELDRQTQRAKLGDGVVGADGLFVLTARRMDADLATNRVTLVDGELVLKKGQTAAQIESAVESGDPAQVARNGTNRITVRAGAIGREGTAWQADDVWLTICECEPGTTPPIAVKASSVDVKPGDEVTLHWPVFRLFDTIPVTPPIPRLTLPLVARRTGFLFPVLSFSGPGGISAELPFFLTLGESADVTFRPRWFRGTALADTAGVGVRGFGGEIEGRWRPAEHAVGALRLAHVFDTSRTKNDDGSIRDAARGNRFFGALDHRQELFGGALGIDARMTSDSGWFRDSATHPAIARRPYLGSHLTWSRATPALQSAWETTVIQDLRPERAAFGDLPATIAPVAKLDLQTFGSLGPIVADSALNISLEEPTPWLTMLDGRASRFLAGASLGQTWPLLRGRGGSVALEFGERAEFLAPRGYEASWRAGGYAGLTASTRLARAFGDLVHDITPSVRLRGLMAFGETSYGNLTPARAFVRPPSAAALLAQSASDLALPTEATTQLVTRLGTSLTYKGRLLVAGALEHHAALAPFDAGQAVLSLTVPILATTLSGGGSYDLELKTPTNAWLRFGGPLGRLSWTTGGTWLAGATNDRIGRGLDLLFTPRSLLLGTASGRVLQGDAALSGNVTTNLSLRAAVAGSYVPPPDEDPTGAGIAVITYAAGASYGAPGCGQVSGGFSYTKGYPPTIAVSFDLGDVSAVAAAVARAFPDAP